MDIRNIGWRPEVQPIRKYLRRKPIQRAEVIEMYKACFAASDDLVIAGVTGGSPESLRSGVRDASPDVVLMGVEFLEAETVEKMRVLRKAKPAVAIVLIFERYSSEGIEALRKFSLGARAGYAYLIGDTVTTMEQLSRMISLAAAGYMIVGTELLGVLSASPESDSALFTLTPREMEKLRKVADRFHGEPNK